MVHMIQKFFRSLKSCGWITTFFVGVSYVSRKAYSLLKKQALRSCGKGFEAQPPMIIRGGENISVGENFRSMGSAYLYGDEGGIVIGNNLSLNTNVILGSSGGKIIIGNNVLIGPNTVLRAANHGLLRNDPINSQPLNGGLIVLKDDVWLGSNVVILKDVTIETGTVVAAGSVVTRNTEPCSIVAGVPAKKIGERALSSNN